MKPMRPKPLREVRVIGPDGRVRPATIVQHYHFVQGGIHDPDEWVESDRLRLRIDGYPDGEQSRHNPDEFYVAGVGDFVVQH